MLYSLTFSQLKQFRWLKLNDVLVKRLTKTKSRFAVKITTAGNHDLSAINPLQMHIRSDFVPQRAVLCCLSVVQELNNRLAAEITKMRSMTSEDGGDTGGILQGKELYELEVCSSLHVSLYVHSILEWKAHCHTCIHRLCWGWRSQKCSIWSRRSTL